MFGIGIPEIIIIAVAVFFVIVGGLAKRGGGISITGPTLVLRKFKIEEDSSTDLVVDIVGRASGFTAWLLTIIGFDAETSLKVTHQEVSFKSSSLFGQTHQVVPLPSASSAHCGYSKPIGYLIVGTIILIGGIIAGLGQRGGGLIILFSIIVGGTFLVAYYLSKKIFISVETSGGLLLGLSFKRSVIENVGVDVEQALKAIMIVKHKIIESQMR